MSYSRRSFLQTVAAAPPLAAREQSNGANWPSFRGPGARGVAEGHATPEAWDAPASKGVRWRTPVPGLGHSSPIVWGDRLFLLSAVRAEAGKAPLQVGRSGASDAADDNGEQSWVALCFATPAVSKGVLYFRTAEELIAVG